MTANVPHKTVEMLLVEDSPGDARLMQEAFKDGKICNRLHHVWDGVEAIAFLRREGEYAGTPRPDLILLDLNLPRKDGRELLAEAKADDELRHIPVIVRRTSDAGADILKSHGLHANSDPVKPVEIGRFFELMRAIESFRLSVVKLPAAGGGRKAA